MRIERKTLVAVCGAEAAVTLDGRELPLWKARAGRDVDEAVELDRGLDASLRA
jgi:allophanate hydrolase subunit 2